MKKNQKLKRGASIIEILTVIAVIAISLTSLLGLSSFSLRASNLIKQTSQANIISQETMEGVRNFRDGVNWNNDDPENKYDGLGKVTTGIYYHLEKSNDVPARWMLIQGEQTLDNFTRKIVFADVYRNAITGNIEAGGNFDPNTKKVTVNVSWTERGISHQIEIITYLTNWKE